MPGSRLRDREKEALRASIVPASVTHQTARHSRANLCIVIESMHAPSHRSTMADDSSTEVIFPCTDGSAIHGHPWTRDDSPHLAVVIINPATGVLARYYHHLARFLVREGYDVVTYDYRGIGRSRPATLRGSGIRWRDWGELDFDAVVRWARTSRPTSPLYVIGHSIGGFLPGM